MAQDAGGDGRQYGLAVFVLELRIRELPLRTSLRSSCDSDAQVTN
jgi:hypothetical protein